MTDTGRRETVLSHLHDARQRGMTWKEMDQVTGWDHHGKTTAVLSGLHKKHKVAKLVERREGCGIYVLPEFVDARSTVSQGTTTYRLDKDAPLPPPAPFPVPTYTGTGNDRVAALESALGEVLTNLGKVHKMGEDRPAAHCVFCDAYRTLHRSA